LNQKPFMLTSIINQVDLSGDIILQIDENIPARIVQLETYKTTKLLTMNKVTADLIHSMTSFSKNDDEEDDFDLEF
jgi:hypothetical protein